MFEFQFSLFSIIQNNSAVPASTLNLNNQVHWIISKTKEILRILNMFMFVYLLFLFISICLKSLLFALYSFFKFFFQVSAILFLAWVLLQKQQQKSLLLYSRNDWLISQDLSFPFIMERCWWEVGPRQELQFLVHFYIGWHYNKFWPMGCRMQWSVN